MPGEESSSTITIPSGEVPRTSPTSAELIVRVQNTQGQPVDGIPVEFQVAPEGSASVSPQRALTNGGTVLVNFAVADHYARDGYQTCDIQGAIVSRNRGFSTNLATSIP